MNRATCCQWDKPPLKRQVHIDTVSCTSEVSPPPESDAQTQLAGGILQQYTLTGNSRAHFGDVYYQGPVHQQFQEEPDRLARPRSIIQTILAAMTGTWFANLTIEYFKAFSAHLWNSICWLTSLCQRLPQQVPQLHDNQIQRARVEAEWEGTCQLICQDLTYSASVCVAICYHDTIQGFGFKEPLHLLHLPYWLLLILPDHLGARRWRSRYPLLYLCAQVMLSVYVGIAFLLEFSLIATSTDSWTTLPLLTISVTGMKVLSVYVSLKLSPFWSCVVKAYIHALVWWPALGGVDRARGRMWNPLDSVDWYLIDGQH